MDADPLYNFEGPADAKHKRKRTSASPGPSNQQARVNKHPPLPNVCGLCGTVHEDGQCYMTEKAENLAEYRRILLSHAGDETIEERVRVLQLYLLSDSLT